MLVWRRSAARFRSSAGWLGLLGVTAGPLEQSNPAQVENAVRETPSAIKLLTSLSPRHALRNYFTLEQLIDEVDEVKDCHEHVKCLARNTKEYD